MGTKVTSDDINQIVQKVNERDNKDFHISKKIKTKHFNYEDHSKQFLLTKPTYTQQYSHIYNARIKVMRHILVKTLNEMEKEEGYVVLQYLKEIKANEKCYCIGTMFKKMENRPSMLVEYTNTIGSSDEETMVNFIHEEDVIFIEDETARLKLEGNINYKEYVTGLTIIFKGRGMNNGSLYVEHIIYPTLPNLTIPDSLNNEDKYVLFVSGLFISESNSQIHAITLLKNWILGLGGDKKISENVVRIVIVGNALSSALDDETNMNLIDLFLSSLCSSTHTDIMPGNKDPSDLILPQQPFPKLLFKQTQNYSSFQCVTNPYLFSLDGLKICCLSGETVQNICEYSNNSSIQSLNMIGKSRILAPTSPDTLGCYPYMETDPFCLIEDEIYPHVFVSGNHDTLNISYVNYKEGENSNKNFKNTEKQFPLLICLPNFAISPKVVLLNLKNLEYQVVSFEVEKNEN